MPKKIHVLIPIVLMTSMIFTGCWDSTEVNNRSIILELAIDKNNDYSYNPDKLIDDQNIYTISYTIPDFGKLSGNESLAKDVENNIEIQAPTIGSSIDDLEIKNKNSVSFSHVKAILLGESLLKDEALFKRTLDSLARDMLIARNVPLIAVNGQAKETTKVENPQQPILGLYIMDYFNNDERATSFFKKQLMGNYIREMDDTGISTLPVFHLEEVDGEKGIVDISGAALIKDYTLVDYLTKEEVRSQLFIEGKIKNSPVVIAYNDTFLTYNIKREKSKLKFNEGPQGIECLIKIEVEGSISEYLSEGKPKLTKNQTIEEVKNLIAQEIIKQINVGLEKSQAINVDYFGIGRALYRQKPKLWNKYKDSWDTTTYKDIPISIGVDVGIQSTGLEE